MATIMVIGYGNRLRGDDGAGPLVAEEIAHRFPHVRAIVVPQLTPELAEALAAVDFAIFVNARLESPDGAVEVRRLEPAAIGAMRSHLGDPCGLLALAQSLYGHAPAAWLVTMPGRDFSFGERLSTPAKKQAGEARAIIENMLRGFGKSHSQAPASPLGGFAEP